MSYLFLDYPFKEVSAEYINKKEIVTLNEFVEVKIVAKEILNHKSTKIYCSLIGTICSKNICFCIQNETKFEFNFKNKHISGKIILAKFGRSKFGFLELISVKK